ncbi:MAG TPA: hypothetical protein VMT32_01270 [Bryobacteraceae bacterium]|nr:hypothetical protein [Bryobacteraceae bacterium]
MSVTVLLAIIWVSCSTGSQEMKGFSIFTDFTFVGSAPYQPGGVGTGGANEQLPKHGTAQVPLPDRPQPGVQYIFHHRRPVDDEKLALVDLPARLKSAGITIVKAPKSSKDLMYPYIGGPLFKIQIQDVRHEGTVYNQIDPELMQGSNPDWAKEDYILLWLK